MAHPDVALDVEGRRAREPERLHVGVDDGLVHGAVHAPRALEARDELLVHGAAVVVDQLDLLVSPVVRVAVVHHDVEPVCEGSGGKCTSAKSGAELYLFSDFNGRGINLPLLPSSFFCVCLH